MNDELYKQEITKVLKLREKIEQFKSREAELSKEDLTELSNSLSMLFILLLKDGQRPQYPIFVPAYPYWYGSTSYPYDRLTYGGTVGDNTIKNTGSSMMWDSGSFNETTVTQTVSSTVDENTTFDMMGLKTINTPEEADKYMLKIIKELNLSQTDDGNKK